MKRIALGLLIIIPIIAYLAYETRRLDLDMSDPWMGS